MDNLKFLEMEVERLKRDKNAMISAVEILQQNNRNAIKAEKDMPTALLGEYLNGFLYSYKREV
jgi:hypothetical protein